MDAKTRKKIVTSLSVAHGDEVNGSSYAGLIRCDYDDLVEALGTPDLEPSGDGKVTCEWDLSLRTDEGLWVIFTVYNYKDDTPPQNNEMWHIGSHHDDDDAIFAFLQKVLRCDVIQW